MRRLLVPEVVQSSSMDCGPAALKSLLEGHGIGVSYGRLREACQTDVDGSDIDVLTDVACALGLDAEQIMVPVDHVVRPEHEVLPALAVVRHADGLTHFVVVWSRRGPLVQLMDPAVGRRWTSAGHLLRTLYVHEMPLPADAVRGYVAAAEFTGPLLGRLRELGVSGRVLVDEALEEATGRSICALDAATRLAAAVSGAISVDERRALVARLWRSAAADPSAIPAPYWFARPAPDDPDQGPMVTLRGAVLLRVVGVGAKGDVGALPPELVAAVSDPSPRPLAALLGFLPGRALLGAVLGGLLLSSAGVVVEALLLRGLLDLGSLLPPGPPRAVALGTLLALSAGLLLLEIPLQLALRGIGRILEGRFRLAFLAKIPRLSDRYFGSRLQSDMAERGHSMHQLRALPLGVGEMARALFGLVLTGLGLAWLDPALAPAALVAVAVAVALPVAALPWLTEQDLRVRTHTSTLARFHLDALRGLVTIRAHGAEIAVDRQHEAQTVEWSRAAHARKRAVVGILGAQTGAGYALAALLLGLYLARAEAPTAALLVAWWALSLPRYGERIASELRQLVERRSVVLRALEPLGAREEAEPVGDPRPATGPAFVRFDAVAVRAAGRLLLEDVTLVVRPGEHVAIVGRSGAGKSTLVGVLLGWHRAASGTVEVDGGPLDVARLRCETVWIDPAVQVWNRTLLHNLRYGTDVEVPLSPVLEDAELLDVLERLPGRLNAVLGEGGGRLSGGEGQRVRLGRGLARPDPRLAILDEPFRGLDRATRGRLLGRARERWKGATLLCVTHDVGDTLSFDRVLVVDGGRVVEDGPPAALRARPASTYAALLAAEEEVREGLWRSGPWRRVCLDEGRLDEVAR